MEAAVSGGASAGGFAPCKAPFPGLVVRLALQKLQLRTARPEAAVSTHAYCMPEQRPAVVFARVIEPALCGATGYCGAALLRQHEGHWRPLWTGSVRDDDGQMLSPEPDGQGGLQFWFGYADDGQRAVREGWRLVPATPASTDCAVPPGKVSASATAGGSLRLCASWSGRAAAQAVEFVPTPPDDTGIVPRPPYRLRHGAGQFEPPSPGDGAGFIQAFRALELTAVCRQPEGRHALLVEQRCEGTGCAPQMRALERGASGWRERRLGDRGWQPLETLLRCGADEEPLDTGAPFRPCACAWGDAQSPSASLAAFEQALRALGAARPLPVPDNDPLELWLHAEGPEVADLTARWDRLWQQSSAAPLDRLDALDADGTLVQRLRFDQGWESAEWVHVQHARSGLRVWIKAELIDSRGGETVFSRETAWRYTAPGVLRVDLGRTAGGGAVEWKIGEETGRWAFRRVPH